MNAVLCYSIPRPLTEAETLVRAALAAEGFGILTEVDVTQTLRQKLSVETYPYRLLGACNPAIAHAAVSADARVGAFLPCGLALYEATPGTTTVCLQNPGAIAAFMDSPGIEAPGREAAARLTRALGSIASPAAGS